ncbi:uncharacterized protein LOC100278836 [Zea mays]|uniref:Uncharacterized protein n=1 Tax=Zea mays TaxID=4577 RepID=B6UEB6_MAIZE|nr:uncharacterized protein LOC100278836 [Zea mays]ACG47699.1 hypothetical protein [Zea mays]|eukprot:NP_001145453.1 uncharacterized protein LOC100278836 [Zea mays]
MDQPQLPMDVALLSLMAGISTPCSKDAFLCSLLFLPWPTHGKLAMPFYSSMVSPDCCISPAHFQWCGRHPLPHLPVVVLALAPAPSTVGTLPICCRLEKRNPRFCVERKSMWRVLGV